MSVESDNCSFDKKPLKKHSVFLYALVFGFIIFIIFYPEGTKSYKGEVVLDSVVYPYEYVVYEKSKNEVITIYNHTEETSWFMHYGSVCMCITEIYDASFASPALNSQKRRAFRMTYNPNTQKVRYFIDTEEFSAGSLDGTQPPILLIALNVRSQVYNTLPDEIRQ